MYASKRGNFPTLLSSVDDASAHYKVDFCENEAPQPHLIDAFVWNHEKGTVTSSTKIVSMLLTIVNVAYIISRACEGSKN